MRVTIDVIAQKCGVSTVTVSRVIANSPNVNEKTRNAILEAMREMNYRPKKMEKLTGAAQTPIIGFMTESIARKSNVEIIQAAHGYLKKEGYLMMVCECGDDAVYQDEYLNVLMNGQMDGCIVISGLGSRQKLAEAVNNRTPLVTVHWCGAWSMSDSVILDNYRGTISAMNYLMDLGHRKIVLLNSPAIASGSFEARMGYVNALQDRGVEVRERYIMEGSLNKESGNAVALKILSSMPEVTAIICSNDTMASGVVEELNSAGKHVPEEVSVISFGISQLNTLEYKFTSVGARYDEAGIAAAKMVLERIREKNESQSISANIKKVTLEPHIFVGKTTAPVRE